METPYEKHKKLNHDFTRYSPPDGFDVIEECVTCGRKFIISNKWDAPIEIIRNIKIMPIDGI